MSGSLNSIKRTEGGCISGQASSPIYTKGSSRKGRETVGEHSGGQTGAGMRVSSGMESKAAMGSYTEKEATSSMKGLGITACSMAKAHSSSKMARDMKEHSRKISSTVKEFSIRTTQ